MYARGKMLDRRSDRTPERYIVRRTASRIPGFQEVTNQQRRVGPGECGELWPSLGYGQRSRPKDRQPTPPKMRKQGIGFPIPCFAEVRFSFASEVKRQLSGGPCRSRRPRRWRCGFRHPSGHWQTCDGDAWQATIQRHHLPGPTKPRCSRAREQLQPIDLGCSSKSMPLDSHGAIRHCSAQRCK